MAKNPFMKMMMNKEKKETSKEEKSEKYTKSKASKMDKMIDKKLGKDNKKKKK